MTRKNVIQILKWIWITVVILGAGYYFYENYPEISQFLKSVRIGRLASGLFFLLVGKLLISDITRLSLKKINHNLTYLQSLSITAVTQLGKYLPGGIWHFAGKFGAYKARGINNKAAIQVMAWENGWLLAGAGIIGSCTLLFTGESEVCTFLPILCDNNLAGLIVILLPTLWIGALLIFEKVLFHQKIITIDFFLSAVEQILIWIVFGISFWFVFPPSGVYLPHIIGVFSISWLAGYIAVFAPGGFGIRELLLTLLLGAQFSNQEITTYAAIHRLMWVLVEVVLAAATTFIFGIPLTDEDENVAAV